MKLANLYRFLVILNIITIQSTIQLVAQNCETDDAHRKLLQVNQKYHRAVEDIQNQVRDIVANNQIQNRAGQVITIPIVIHVIEDGVFNITDTRILEAIDRMNQDWRNASGEGTDMDVEFCLAAVDPNGNPTTGINRVSGVGVPNYVSNGIGIGNGNGAPEQSIKSLSIWPNTQYYNIWVVNFMDQENSGYAYFPGASASIDGAVVAEWYMSEETNIPAHELGHGFNLYHTFQGDEDGTICPPNNNCAFDGDQVCDTPPHKVDDCGSFNPCTSTGFWDNSLKNHMGYCFWDVESTIFTAGQKERVQATLQVWPRSALINSNVCTPGSVGDNNDNCSGAIQLDVNTSCVSIQGNGANATESAPGCAGNANDDVWFSFVATGPEATVQIAGSSGYDAVAEFYDGNCSSLTSFFCLDNTYEGDIETLNIINLVAGSTYYFRVYDYYASATTTTFDVCVYSDYLSVEEAAFPNAVVYPNPTNGLWNVDFGESVSNATVSIHNAIGSLVYSETVQNTQYFSHEITSTPGIYFVQITNENGATSGFKIVKR